MVDGLEIKARMVLFQFLKGAINAHINGSSVRSLLCFNSLKVRLNVISGKERNIYEKVSIP